MKYHDTPVQNYRSAAGARAVLDRYQEVLAGWPVPNQQRTVPTREGPTFVISSGPDNAPPVVALQGSSANTARWLPNIGAWAQRLRIHGVDLIGEPGLSAPSRPPMTSDAYALWLDDVMEGLGLSHASLIGVSLSGWVTTDYATRRPQRITSLVLLAPGGIGRAKVGVAVKSLLLRPFGRWGRRQMLLSVAGRRPTPGGADGGSAPRPDPARWQSLLPGLTMLIFKHFRPRRQRLPLFSDDALRRLTMPVLAVVGGKDVIFNSRQTAQRLRRAAPHATITFLPHARHILPDQTIPVLEFLLTPTASNRTPTQTTNPQSFLP